MRSSPPSKRRTSMLGSGRRSSKGMTRTISTGTVNCVLTTGQFTELTRGLVGEIQRRTTRGAALQAGDVVGLAVGLIADNADEDDLRAIPGEPTDAEVERCLGYIVALDADFVAGQFDKGGERRGETIGKPVALETDVRAGS